jgi:hypothetical protein
MMARCATDPVIAGHYQRIHEIFLYCGEDWISESSRREFYRNLVHYAPEPITIFAYHQFLIYLPIDFEFPLVSCYGKEGDEAPVTRATDLFFISLLRHAFALTLTVERYSRSAHDRLAVSSQVYRREVSVSPLRNAPVNSSGEPL